MPIVVLALCQCLCLFRLLDIVGAQRVPTPGPVPCRKPTDCGRPTDCVIFICDNSFCDRTILVNGDCGDFGMACVCDKTGQCDCRRPPLFTTTAEKTFTTIAVDDTRSQEPTVSVSRLTGTGMPFSVISTTAQMQTLVISSSSSATTTISTLPSSSSAPAAQSEISETSSAAAAGGSVSGSDSFANPGNVERGHGLDSWMIGVIAAIVGVVGFAFALIAVACLLRRRRTPPPTESQSRGRQSVGEDGAEYGVVPPPSKIARQSAVSTYSAAPESTDIAALTPGSDAIDQYQYESSDIPNLRT